MGDGFLELRVEFLRAFDLEADCVDAVHGVTDSKPASSPVHALQDAVRVGTDGPRNIKKLDHI